MLDPENVVILGCGIVAEPKVYKDTVANFRVGVDYAGNEKAASGYFDVTYFLNNEGSNATFVKNQLAEGKMSKGSQIKLVGRLKQDPWEDKDGNKRDKVVIIAESITYAKRSGAATTNAAAASQTATIEAPQDF